MKKKEIPVEVDPYFQEIVNRSLKMEDVSPVPAMIKEEERVADAQAKANEAYDAAQREKHWQEKQLDEHRTTYAGTLVGAAMSASGCNLSDVHQAFMTELVKTLCLEMGKSRPGMF